MLHEVPCLLQQYCTTHLSSFMNPKNQQQLQRPPRGLQLVVVDLGGTAQATGAAGGDEADLLAGHAPPGHGGGVANVLVVTTPVGMLHGVHGHTTHHGPAVALDPVLVVGPAGLQHGLLRAAAASHHADHGAAGAGHHLRA